MEEEKNTGGMKLSVKKMESMAVKSVKKSVVKQAFKWAPGSKQYCGKK